MKEGRIVEEGSMEQIFYEPVHPYTKKSLGHGKKALSGAGEKNGPEKLFLRTQGLGKKLL